MRNAYKFFVGKPEDMRPLGRPKRRWDDIRPELRETEWKSMEWIHLVPDRDQWRGLVTTEGWRFII
jgi:hypothetical protein